jgi:hypothetical protein
MKSHGLQKFGRLILTSVASLGISAFYGSRGEGRPALLLEIYSSSEYFLLFLFAKTLNAIPFYQTVRII